MGKMEERISKYVRTISYTELLLWDVKRYIVTKIKSKYPIESLSLLIQERNEKHKLFDFPERLFGILGVNNKEGLFDAYIEKGARINQPYKKMFEGDLAYNPYRINVGSIGLKTNQHLNEYISPAYVVFSCKEELLPDFLYKLFKTKTFNDIINDNTTGSVRQNLKFETLSLIKIPLPSISEQKRLIREYNAKIKIAQEQEKEALGIELGIENYLYEILELQKNEQNKNYERLGVVNFKTLARWSVEYISKHNSIATLLNGKYKAVCLGDFLDSFQYGLSEKSSSAPIGIPMLRMNNIYNSEVMVKDLKYIQIDDNTKEKYLLHKGDLLFNRTNSKELVGKTAVFYEGDDYTFASYIIRVKLNPQKANVDYINYLFNSRILQFQKDMISRKILGQANINSQEMQEFLFPLPPLPIQNEIAGTIKKMKAEIKTLKEQAEYNRSHAIKEFENEIFIPCN
jgi:restriction endonuclease S subunit